MLSKPLPGDEDSIGRSALSEGVWLTHATCCPAGPWVGPNVGDEDFLKNSVLIVRETEARQQRLRSEWAVGRWKPQCSVDQLFRAWVVQRKSTVGRDGWE